MGVSGAFTTVHIAWRDSSIADPTFLMQERAHTTHTHTHTDAHTSCLEMTNRERMMWWDVHYRRTSIPALQHIQDEMTDGSSQGAQDSWRMYDMHIVCPCVCVFAWVCECVWAWEDEIVFSPFRKSYGKQIFLLWSRRNSFAAFPFPFSLTHYFSVLCPLCWPLGAAVLHTDIVYSVLTSGLYFESAIRVYHISHNVKKKKKCKSLSKELFETVDKDSIELF